MSNILVKILDIANTDYSKIIKADMYKRMKSLLILINDLCFWTSF